MGRGRPSPSQGRAEGPAPVIPSRPPMLAIPWDVGGFSDEKRCVQKQDVWRWQASLLLALPR